jgi:outer membrane protein assembly factor BamB
MTPWSPITAQTRFRCSGAALAAICLLSGVLPRAAAQEWVRFRGPNGAGLSNAASVPIEWTEADFNWRVELPGIGHSAPVVWGDRIFLTSAENEDATRVVLCLAAEDGRTLWSRRYASTLHPKHQLNSFASSTPTVDEARVYVVWSSPEEYSVRAFDHDGQEVWQRSLGPYESQHSCGTSPIVFENLLIIGNDQDGPSSLFALNRETGDVVWQVPRKNREVAYSTPCLLQRDNHPVELIFNSGAHGITSLDPRTGRLNWEIDVFDKRSVSSPVIAGDLLIGTCGSGGGGNYVVAVKPPASDGLDPALAYKLTKSAPYVPTPLYKDGLLFLWSDQGVVSAIEAQSGEPLWQNRVGGRFFGSPVCIANRLYAMSDAGEAVVVAADREFKLLARNPIGEGSHSTPSVADGVLYLRTFSHLIAIGGKS